MPRLLMIAPAPVKRLSDGRLRLDVKFVEGMRLHGKFWGGPVSVVLRDVGLPIPFGSDYSPEELGFDVHVLPPDEPLGTEFLKSFDTIAASADIVEALDFAEGRRLPVVYTVEYTLGTRLKIVALDRGLGWPRKLWSMLWNLRMEARRRRAFRRAAGLQVNGFPAHDAYRRLNASTLLYLDGRMSHAMMATPAEMAARAARLRSGAPLRIAHSGRLETMKGAQDLLPIARSLQQTGTAFTLDVFGAGSLAAEMAAALGSLGGVVRLHGPVDFEAELVPWMRTHADLFLSCHRQSDPSCTYLETMGCGVPVIGYANAMWSRLREVSDSGWVVPMGDRYTMAREVARLAREREALVQHAGTALAFARKHDFETEFARRMEHYRACSNTPVPASR